MDPLELYRAARAAGAQPALLESLGVRTSFGRRTLLGLHAARYVEVRDGRLFDDGREVGAPLDLFDLLEEAIAGGAGRDSIRGIDGRARAGAAAGGDVFPAWIGFLSYEFARHFGLPVNDPMPGLPEAAFSFYPQGWVWEDGGVRERPGGVGGGGGGGGGGRDVSPPPPAPPGPHASLVPLALPPIVLESDYPPEDFIAGVDAVQERIRAGWVYQVNLSHRFNFDAAGVDPLVCYELLRAANPSPFFGLLEGDDWAVVSGSPERLFEARDRRVTARPIAGTRPRAAGADEDDALQVELLADRKERAEHVMLVDLLRNDVSKVCESGSVAVDEAFTVERYSHVMHLVSEVVGRRAAGASLGDLVAAIFPGGTITGAPKESVMDEIARLEPVPRGAYTGALGYVSAVAVDFNILIRSFTFAGLQRRDERVVGGRGFVSGGGGIVIESDPETEYLETRHKVEALLAILGAGRGGEAPQAPRREDSWRPSRPRASYPARVLFLENHDSFSYNIVNYLRMLGAEVDVIDHAVSPTDRSAAATLSASSHVVVGPGPGDPWTSGRTLDWVAAALTAGRPYLGICLGHQALGVAVGARLERAPRPVHGEDHLINHHGRGLFAGLPTPAPFTRYNSLVLTDLPAPLILEAWSTPTGGPGDGVGLSPDEGLVMAVSHRSRPAWGVQVHPESMLSPHGLELLANFLEME